MTDEWDQILSTPPVSEEYDSTWPYNFKWGFNAQNNQADVWHVQGGVDGRPVHRKELTDRWGRQPSTRDGDVMGLATYIPAEKKIDGTVVAPPEVHVQTYYDQPTPPVIQEWFRQQFPHAIVRDAIVVPSKTQIFGKTADWDPTPVDRPEVLKWAFNRKDGLLLWEAHGEDGLPTHQQKVMSEWGRHMTLTSDWDAIQGKDEIGYAYPTPEKVEVQRWDYKPIDTEAMSALRQHLAEWYPNATVVDEAEPQADSFQSDPNDWHTAAVNWAWETLPDGLSERSVSAFGGSERSQGLLARIFSKRVVAEADKSGCMVALFIPEEAGKKLKVRRGEPLEDMHITLLYFSDKQDERDDWDEVKKIVEQIANQSPPMSGKISGYGVFGSEDGDVLWASPSVVGLAELRHKIYEACEDAGFHVNTEHDWVPHITLKYDHKGKLPKTGEDVELEFAELSFAMGDDHFNYKLDGHLEKTTGWDVPYDYDGYVNPNWGEVPPRMYHVAPRSARDSILAEGLDPTGRTWNTGGDQDLSDWSEGKLDRGEGAYEWRPEAVYMFNNHHDARGYARWGGPEWGWQPEDGHDMWEVDTTQVPDILRDPAMAHNWGWDPDDDVAYMAQYVPPSALRLVDRGEYLARRLSSQRLGFIKIAPAIEELAQRAIQNLQNREDILSLGSQYLLPNGQPAGPQNNTQNSITNTRTLAEMRAEGFEDNPKFNPVLWGGIMSTLGQLPPEVFKFYPWVVKQMKTQWAPATQPWGNVNHLKDILTQAFQHMEYLRSQPPGSPNAAPVPDINQMDFAALEQWVYQRNSTGIDVRPGVRWEYGTGEYAPGANGEYVDYEYPHPPQQKKWDVGDGYTVWPVWTENDLKQEGNLMGHCVGGYCQAVHSGSSIIFSLRDSKGEPHATIELEGSNGLYNVVQIQGKQNNTPDDKYKAKVREFFNQLSAEGYTLTQRVSIQDLNDLEEYEWLSTPDQAYGIEPDVDVDEYNIARDLVENAQNGYGTSSAEDALERLMSEGIIDRQSMGSEIKSLADDALEEKERDLRSEWEYERDRLEREYDSERDEYAQRRAAEEEGDPDDEDYEEPDPSDYEDEFMSFEEWLEEYHPDEYHKEVYGFEEEAEDELSDVVDLRYRFSSVKKTAADPPDWKEKYNYRQATGRESCATCDAFVKGRCQMFSDKAEADMTCDEWTDKPTWRLGATNDYLDWGGWDGSHQFVTDGRDILHVPATERIDSTMTGDHPVLHKKFREIYPEAKGFVGGWAVPTADGLGTGIWAPYAGHGDKHAPGIHEIIPLIEEQFGKPAHLITNGDHLADEGMYRQGIESEWQTLSYTQTKPN